MDQAIHAVREQYSLLASMVRRHELFVPMLGIWVASFGGALHAPVTTYFQVEVGASTVPRLLPHCRSTCFCCVFAIRFWLLARSPDFTPTGPNRQLWHHPHSRRFARVSSLRMVAGSTLRLSASGALSLLLHIRMPGPRLCARCGGPLLCKHPPGTGRCELLECGRGVCGTGNAARAAARRRYRLPGRPHDLEMLELEQLEQA